MKQLFLPSKYYTGGVLHIPSDGDDPCKLKSTPKKNEYFEYSNKLTAKKGLSQKISERKISNQEKKHTSIIPVTWKNRSIDHFDHFDRSQVKMESSPIFPTDNLDSQGSILPSCSKELEE